MHRRPFTSIAFSLKNYAPYFSIALMLLAADAFGQKRSAKEERAYLVDSTYADAERRGLNTNSLLRYEFYFADPDTTVLRKLGRRLEQDTFEVLAITPSAKTWRLAVTKHLQIDREAMIALDARLRWLRYNFLADEYLGFAIKPRNPDPVNVEESVFHAYIDEITDEELYWVSRRLVQLKNYPRAQVALVESVERMIYPDTVRFLFGQVMVATNEFNEGMEYWDEALRINPDYLEAHMRYAALLYANTYFKRSLEHYQEADRIRPNDPVILYHIAETLFQLKRYHESLAYAKRSYKLDRKHPYTKSLIKLLKEPRIRYLRKQELKAMQQK